MAVSRIPAVPRVTAAEQADWDGSGERGAARPWREETPDPGRGRRGRERIQGLNRQDPGGCRKVGTGGPVVGLVLNADEVIVGVALGFGMTLRLDSRPVVLRPDIQYGNCAGKGREDGHDKEGNDPQEKGDSLLHPPLIPSDFRPASSMEILA